MNDLYSQKKARIDLPFNRQKASLLLAFSDRDVPLNTPHYCQLNIHFSFTLGICMRQTSFHFMPKYRWSKMGAVELVARSRDFVSMLLPYRPRSPLLGLYAKST